MSGPRQRLRRGSVAVGAVSAFQAAGAERSARESARASTAPDGNAQEAVSPEAVAAVATPAAVRRESTPPKRSRSYSIV